MIPLHERSLVEEDNRPFALVGVNSDGTNAAAGL